MESGGSVKDIAQNLCEYMSSVSPQVGEQGKLQYYMCGSLATMLLSNAISVERCSVTGELVESSLEEKAIPQEARDTLSLFARPMHDIDVINVAGNVVENSKITVDGRVKNRDAGEADGFISKLRDRVKTIGEMAEEVGTADEDIARKEVVGTPNKGEI